LPVLHTSLLLTKPKTSWKASYNSVKFRRALPVLQSDQIELRATFQLKSTANDRDSCVQFMLSLCCFVMVSFIYNCSCVLILYLVVVHCVSCCFTFHVLCLYVCSVVCIITMLYLLLLSLYWLMFMFYCCLGLLFIAWVCIMLLFIVWLVTACVY